MKTVTIDAADSCAGEPAPSVTRITIRKGRRVKTFSESVEREKKQAKELYDTLEESLPYGTLDALWDLIAVGK